MGKTGSAASGRGGTLREREGERTNRDSEGRASSPIFLPPDSRGQTATLFVSSAQIVLVTNFGHIEN